MSIFETGVPEGCYRTTQSWDRNMDYVYLCLKADFSIAANRSVQSLVPQALNSASLTTSSLYCFSLSLSARYSDIALSSSYTPIIWVCPILTTCHARSTLIASLSRSIFLLIFSFSLAGQWAVPTRQTLSQNPAHLQAQFSIHLGRAQL